MPETSANVKARYQAALDTFVAQVRQDGWLYHRGDPGRSLSHDEVWAKSDIDIGLNGRSDKQPERFFCLLVDGINIRAWLIGAAS